MTTLDWKDISDETERTYFFPNGAEVTIVGPLQLNVKTKANGDSHRIVSANGSYYIPVGWIAIRWKVKQGATPVAF